jgi:hypothetical protein
MFGDKPVMTSSQKLFKTSSHEMEFQKIEEEHAGPAKNELLATEESSGLFTIE